MRITFPLATMVTLMAQTNGDAHTLIAHRGTEIDGTLTTFLSTNDHHSGQHFLLHPKRVHAGTSVLPPGSLIEGHVEEVSPATSHRKATMVLRIDGIRLPDAELIPMRARVLAANLNSSSQKTVITDNGNLKIISRTKSNVNLKKGTLIRVKAVVDISYPQTKAYEPVTAPAAPVYEPAEQTPF